MKNLQFFTLLFACLPLFVAGQNADIYKVNLVYPTYSSQVEVLQDAGKYKPNENLTYYWLKSKDIHQSRGDFEGKLLHGEYIEFYLDKNLKEKGQFYKGLKDGEWKYWHTNGELSEVVHWNRGHKSGLYKKIDERGNVLLVSNFKNGKLHGLTTSYENGKELRRTIYHTGEEVAPKESKPKKQKKVRAPREKKVKPSKEKKPATPKREKQKEPKKEKPNTSEESTGSKE